MFIMFIPKNKKTAEEKPLDFSPASHTHPKSQFFFRRSNNNGYPTLKLHFVILIVDNHPVHIPDDHVVIVANYPAIHNHPFGVPWPREPKKLILISARSFLMVNPPNHNPAIVSSSLANTPLYESRL